MKISRAEAQAAKKRWENINAAEIRELRRTPLSEKITQLAALMASTKAMGWDTAPSDEEIEVRMRWLSLKKAKHAR
jgi:hypothetical protein